VPSISVALLDFDEFIGQRGYGSRTFSTKALSSSDYHRILRCTLCESVRDLQSRLSRPISAFVEDYDPVHRHWLLQAPHILFLSNTSARNFGNEDCIDISLISMLGCMDVPLKPNAMWCPAEALGK
jgi:hypothetical protein